MELEEKLRILTESAKYDVSCASSGSDRARSSKGGVGTAVPSGVCHSWSSDGRCVSLLKILLSNKCIYNCEYCVNRVSNNIERATMTPEEVADITINFYKRNYIEGLFLSSGVVRSPDHTMELIYRTLLLLREKYLFSGYIHAKLIPGSSDLLIEKVTALADRVSSNIELPSSESLKRFAPDKSRADVLYPIKYVRNLNENLPVPASRRKNISMSTQMIIGASPESDQDILRLSEYFYNKSLLKRVYYSAYVPVNLTSNLPCIKSPPLLREHRLYQADWLLRFYQFKLDEIVGNTAPNLSLEVDPKTAWAIRNLHLFPMDVNRVDMEMLIRVPGIGVRSAQKIIKARRFSRLDEQGLARLGVSLKKARYFLAFNGKYAGRCQMKEDVILSHIMDKKAMFYQPLLFNEF